MVRRWTRAETQVALEVIAGGVVPVLANFVFNVFANLVSDGVEGKPFALDVPTYDISVGCAFAIVGVWVSCRDELLQRVLPLAVLFMVFSILGVGLYELIEREFSVSLIILNDIVFWVILMGAIWRAK